MANYTQRVVNAMFAVSLLLACGCTALPATFQSLVRRGAAVDEVRQKKVDYRSDLHEQRMTEKLAEIDDRLRTLNQIACTQTETTLAMEMSQSLEIQDITVDVEELKNVIARAEAHARAESLRQERLPGLLREQQEAFGGDAFGVNEHAPGFEQVAYDRNVRQAADEADIVVGIDQKGDLLPFHEDKRPMIGPSEIPYIVRMRINVGLENPRMEKSKVRRHLNCGKAECSGKGCSKCAQLTQSDPGQFTAATATPADGSRAASNAYAATGWPTVPGGSQYRLPPADPASSSDARTATEPLAGTYPATESPKFNNGGIAGSTYAPVYSVEPGKPLTATHGEPTWSRVRDATNVLVR